MPRGIDQDDVWKAADALLIEGARPTIERIRQKIGRGSPNTVSPSCRGIPGKGLWPCTPPAWVLQMGRDRGGQTLGRHARPPRCQQRPMPRYVFAINTSHLSH